MAEIEAFPDCTGNILCTDTSDESQDEEMEWVRNMCLILSTFNLGER